MALPDFSQMTPEQLQAFLSGQYGNIGTPTLNADDRYGGEGQGTGFYSGGGLDFLSQTPDGFTGPIGAPYDQAGQSGIFGQNFGAWDTMGNMTGSEFQQQDRPSFLDKNGFLAPLLPIAAAGAGALFGGAPGAVPTGLEAATTSGSAASSGINSALASSQGATLGGGITANGGLTAGGITAGGGLGAGGLSAGGAGATLGATAGAGGIGSLLEGLGGMRGLAAGAGALAGALGTPTGNSVSEQSVPEWLRPYATDLAQRGQTLADQPFQPFSGQRYADPNQAQQNAWEMVNQAASNPTAQQGQAATAFQNLLQAQAPNIANGARVDNQYIGQSSPTASNQYIGQGSGSNVSGLMQDFANPYLGQTTQQIGPLGQMSLQQSTTGVGQNALLGLDNPYLNDAIKYAQGDVTRNFDQSIAPRLAAMSRASGSFGNSGVQQQEQEAYRNLAGELGRVSSGMRMQDYGLQAQLGEGDLSRRLQAGLTDASRNLGASQAEQQFNIGTDYQRQLANSGMQAQDLARNLSGANAQQGNALQAGMFDATQRANDLSRNASLQQGLGQFNATMGAQDLARNASLAGQQQQFNAQQGNQDTTNQLNAWNSAQNRAASALPQWQAFAEQPYRAANALGTVGNQMYGIANQNNQFSFDEFMRQQQQPYQQLGMYSQLYGAARGGNQTQTTPAGGNQAAGALGGAASGLGLYNLFNRGF